MKRFLEIVSFLYVFSAFFIIYTKANPVYQTPPIDYSKYNVVIWEAPGCWSCIKYKKKELPKLEKRGYNVEVRDGPSGETAPTITLYYGEVVLHTEVYWTAEDINKFVENRSKIK